MNVIMSPLPKTLTEGMLGCMSRMKHRLSPGKFLVQSRLAAIVVAFQSLADSGKLALFGTLEALDQLSITPVAINSFQKARSHLILSICAIFGIAFPNFLIGMGRLLFPKKHRIIHQQFNALKPLVCLAAFAVFMALNPKLNPLSRDNIKGLQNSFQNLTNTLREQQPNVNAWFQSAKDSFANLFKTHQDTCPVQGMCPNQNLYQSLPQA